MGAVLGVFGAGLQGCGVGLTSVFTFAGSVCSVMLDIWLVAIACLTEVASYALSMASVAFACFAAVLVPMLTEFLRPASEWRDSQAKQAGPGCACCACFLVVGSILVLTLLLVFLVTFLYYDAELALGSTAILDEVSRR